MNPVLRDRRFLTAGAIAVVVGSTAFWFLRPVDDEPEVPVIEPAPILPETVELREYQLYYPGEDGRLHPKARDLPLSLEPTENISRLVEALLEGPHGEFAAKAIDDPGGAPSDETSSDGADRSDEPAEDKSEGAVPAPPLVSLADLEPEDGLWPPFPPEVALGRAYLLDDATVILDLVSPDGRTPNAGSRAEVVMLYSLVNTVLLNIEEAERLVLLWNGQQPSTFTGHFDTTRPLESRPELIAR